MDETTTAVVVVDAVGAELVRAAPGGAATDPVVVYLASLASPNSRRAMSGALELAARTLSGGALGRAEYPWAWLRYQHVAALRSALAATRAPRTVNLVLAGVRGVAREAWRLGLLPTEDHARIADVEGVRVATAPAGRSLAGGELRALLAACGTDAAGRRDAALVAVLYAAGVRRAELAALELRDYDRTTGALAVRSGKGRKDRTAYLADGAVRALDAWLAVRGDGAGALFVCIHKSGAVDATLAPMTPTAVRGIVARVAARAGVADVTPHDFRRTMVGDLLDAGADISTVAALVGHASVTTTQRYDRRGEAVKRRAASLLHVPVAA